MNDDGFTLTGYEDLEISTQILISDALRHGITVTVLDRKNNFLELKKGGKTEIVKQATMTSKDSLISYMIMENKAVSNQMLREAGLMVPDSHSFDSPGAAIDFSQRAEWNKMVIKPATTNFGIGISIIDAQSDSAIIEAAIADAFSFAETILLEEFIEGREYRFLVVDFQSVAVCQRIPANILGDGMTSVKSLVELKNRDPRRGQGYVTPLEKIELGETELGVLREDYGYDHDSIPAKDETVFMRRNSNISTGGDSIDCTDLVSPFYARIAQRAAQTAGARICGVDMILSDPERESDYAILELNFNPVLYIHNYPYQGTNRHVGDKILDLLGF